MPYADSTLLGHTGGPPGDPPASAIAAFSRVHDGHDEIHKALDLLEERLKPVLMEPRPFLESTAEQTGLSPLAGRLMEASHRAHLIAERVAALAARIDL
jgi:hypothetical protein